MQVNNVKMYHYHKQGVYDGIWREGSSFIVDKNFDSYYGTVVKTFQTGVFVPEGKNISFSNVLSYYLGHPETIIEDPALSLSLLAKAKEIILMMDAFQREFVLESYRRNHYPELPSRYHSIWVTDKKSLEYWKKMLTSSEYEMSLLELELTGELFKTSASFLPEEGFPLNQTYADSEYYWNPKFKTKEEEQKKEYLFQGNVKVLKKII